jgi:hypothetical protein
MLAFTVPTVAQHAFDGNIVWNNGAGGAVPYVDECGGGWPNFVNILASRSYNDLVNPQLTDPLYPGHNWMPLPGSPARCTVDDVAEAVDWYATTKAGSADTCNLCDAQRTIQQVDFRGAIDPNAPDWTTGWTCYDLLGSCGWRNTNLVAKSGAQPTSVWTSGNTYVLQGKVWFPAGTTLTIEPGTVILGENASGGYLVIDRGAQIYSNGTVDRPVIMTTDLDPPISGGWGGLVIHGRAVANCADCLGGQSCQSEGGAGDFCGTDDCDNSGSITYTRVQYSGIEISPANELNSFTFNGVGSLTTAHHLQAHMGSDDSFEWFGGYMNCKYIIATGQEDDGLDWQMGYRGSVQFAVAQQYPGIGDKGIEADNNEYDFDAPCRSNPIFANVTLIGQPSRGGLRAPAHGIHMRKGTGALLYNFIIQNFPSGGVRWQHVQTCQFQPYPQGPFWCSPLTGVELVGEGASDFSVRAFPNPVQTGTQFEFSLPHAGETCLSIFDVRGRIVDRVVDRHLPAGIHRVDWQPATELASGTYFYRLENGGEPQMGKLVVVR